MSAITSTLKIYKKCQAIPERRLVIDDFPTYLGTLTGTTTISSFQYIRHALRVDIKVNLSQTAQEFTSEYNYCSIQNGDSTKVVYYFIRKIRQVAQTTVLFELEMDVLNTFKWNVDFAVSPKTEVYREHKDRWIKKVVLGINYYIPNIDFYSEGINAPLYKSNQSTLRDNDVGVGWYLIYKNRTTPSDGSPAVIDCFCAPSDIVNVKANSERVFNAYNAPAGYEYISVSARYYSSAIDCICSDETDYRLGDAGSTYEAVIITPAGSQLFVRHVRYNQNGGIDATLDTRYTDYVKFYVGGSQVNTIKCNLNTYFANSLIAGTDNGTWNSGENTYTLSTFDTLDRTDVLLNKIIALPYFPNDYTMTGSVMNIPTEWEFDGQTGFLKLIDINTKFNRTLLSQITDPIRSNFPTRSLTYFGDGTRDDKYELKLYHSDFYQIKFVYDSFTYILPIEKVDFSNLTYTQTNFSFKFIHTNTMNSRFLFAEFSNYPWKYVQEDYNAILSVARNNEVVIYNSPYLNYLRTSYNFDVKARDRQIKATEIGSTIGLVGSGAGMIMSWASMNPVVAISGTTSAGTSIASNIVNRINSVAQAEESFARKQEEMKIQSVTIAGADDLDLLEYYSENKAKLCIYQVSDRMKDLVSDLFYYCGYKTNETKIPSVNTRRQFNYLECNLHIVEVYSTLGGKYIPDECINKLKEDYLAGVTFIHHYASTWDLQQESTNLETSIV